MKKLKNHKDLNKIAKGALAIVLAGSFTFFATNAFADGNDQSANQTTNQQTATTTQAAVSVNSIDKQETPTLLPGDFFYFTKIAFEKIQLALTFNHVKEAKLLASNASERLAEAHALFTSGDEQKAVDTLKSALEDMDGADKVVEENQAKDQDQVKENGETTNVHVKNDAQKSTEDQESNKQTTDTKVTNAQSTNEDQATNEPTEIKDIKDILSQNIAALSAAMEKVKNPVAKAALEKNIEKSYAKLAKKMEKWNKHIVKEQKKGEQSKVTQVQGNTDENSPGTDEKTTGETNTSATNTSGTLNTNVSVTNQNINTALPSTPVKQEEQANHESQTIQKSVHQEEHQIHQVAKQKSEEVRSLVKEKKDDVERDRESHKDNNRKED
ncbi:DUF5667 domain-containing protein [Neobacillus ginsengisoli]|uniref:DUF5667 domain-containing protein n=1 Tax=Neobacillus ginsengisoli TaxID=904295 RepID=A0ABT9XTU5_9BACI|nr:DUF5667 domain-containing protein [Neobacillus ginsengisoli]MDQ0198357.1 hypothetical protein [Neobacillus ginsengisoli]